MSMFKIAAICAHMVVSAHCHVWDERDKFPNEYMPSVTITWDADFRPIMGKSPCIFFKGLTATWWDIDNNGKPILRMRGAGIENPLNCYADIVHSMDGWYFQIDDHPAYIPGGNAVVIRSSMFDVVRGQR